MYKVLIVEDEMYVRMGIKMLTEWERLGFEVIADVENGKQALAVYETLHPDIIITDIKMPLMDGMELIREIRKQDERARFIILTCLEDFDVVREAISMDVTDYVLKLTVNQDDMERVLSKVKKELIILDRTKQDKEELRDEKYFQERFLNYLYYRIGMGAEVEEWLKSRFGSADKKFVMLVLEIDHYEERKRMFNDSYGDILISAVGNILSEIMMEEKHILIPEKKGHFIIMLEGEEERQLPSEHMLQIMERIREILNRYVKSSITFGISHMGIEYEYFYEMYVQCLQALEKKFYHGLDKNYFYSLIKPDDYQTMIQRKMNKLIQNHKADEAKCRLFEDAMKSFCQHGNSETIKHFFEQAVNMELVHILPEGDQRFQITASFKDKLNECQTFDEILDIYEECMKYFSEAKEGQTGLSKPVKDILYFISSHYAENITLNQIAEMVDLSRTYVCGLFKKEMGVNLTNYIMAYRIDKAKELLKTTNMKSYEIAEKVGFPDISYFSRTFKKLTGQSPNAYKKML